jgi:uncharacterized protein (DUF58 family)
VSATKAAKNDIRRALDWGALAPLRLRARAVAEGVYAGMHRSARRGAGVEFGGHREYTPGDDLRWLDRRSLLRHERLVVRQFETETDRALRVLVDATGSMSYRGARAPGAKLAFAAVVAAALTRVALSSGDPVGLAFVGGEGGGARPVPQRSGREQFERVVGTLEAVVPGGDAHTSRELLDRAFDAFERGTRRGAILVVLSDLLDLPDGTAERIAALSSRGRILIVAQVLDPDEATFPFDGTVRLRAMEGEHVVETEPSVTRARYLAALEALKARWETTLTRRGARFVPAVTTDDPVQVVRAIVAAAR